MHDTTSSTPPDMTSDTATWPFPGGSGTPPVPGVSAQVDAGYTRFGDRECDAPVADDLIERARQGAHETVDNVADKLLTAAQGVQDSVSKAGNARDAWLDSARDAIRQHPIVAVAGALLIGAAVSSLTSSRDD
jgi:hypothetical protein